jgi:hypothetical protein
MRVRRAVSSALTAAVAGAVFAFAVTAAFADDQPPDPQPGKSRMHALANVNFISACRFSHRAPDDPIVYPGKPGLSHDHSFVGNTSTSAFSTLRTLRAGGTTCRRQGDTAGYWVPTLFVDGQAVTPRGATIYYRRRVTDHVQPFPQGLKMIAGESHSMMPQSLRVTFWNCGAEIMVPPSSTAPACPDELGSGLRLHVTFPSCWDGKRLDSADHKSHMAYPAQGACPSTHPVAVPAISLIYRYPVTGSHEIELASGGQYSAHADFFNAWDPPTLARLVDSCLNALRHCARGD